MLLDSSCSFSDWILLFAGSGSVKHHLIPFNLFYSQGDRIMRKIHFGIVLCIAALFIAAVSARRLRLYIVMSGSMEPGITTGSLIITDTIMKDPAPGDVITYHAGGTRITHRVIRILENNMVITKGDHNASEDPLPVHREEIEGTVLLAVPGLGTMLLMLRRPSAFCLLVLPVIFITVFRSRCVSAGSVHQSKERSGK